MVQFIQRGPSFGEQLAQSLGGAAQNFVNQFAEMSIENQKRERERSLQAIENETIKNLTGQDLSGLSSDLKKVYLQNLVKQKEDKAIEKSQTLNSMRETIDQLKSMAENDVPGIGVFGEYDPRPEAQKNRGMLQTLSSDLLSFYKTLFPRGITQQEFIRLEKDYIPKAGDATSKMLGKLEGFQNLISRKLKELGEEGHGETGKIKFSSSNPEHKAKRDQLMKKFKGNREKVREALLREFEE